MTSLSELSMFADFPGDQRVADAFREAVTRLEEAVALLQVEEGDLVDDLRVMGTHFKGGRG